MPPSEAAQRVISGDWQRLHSRRPDVSQKDLQVALFRSLVERAVRVEEFGGTNLLGRT